MTIPVHPLRNHVIEFHQNLASVATGIVANVPKVRRIAIVSHERPDGTLFCTDSDGATVIIDPGLVNFTDLGIAKAGWGKW